MTAQTDIASSSSSYFPPPTPRWIYDVFLSFRGTDTRNGFTDFLYNTLKQKGIHTYRDNEELERGKEIASGLLKAIEESRYAVVVLSDHYADSAWCLDEVVKVVECMKLRGQTVVPVFYHVDPSEVRRQKGSFEKAFAKHEIRYKDDPERVKRWRSALTDVANLSGWHLKDRAESEVVREIVRYIFNKLSYQTISNRPCTELVGIDSRVNKLLDYLDMNNMAGVCTVGVLGMGGIGKTTIVQEVCDRICGQFEAYSFVPKVREVSGKQGLVHLQKQLISDILMESDVNIQSIKRGIDIMSQRFCSKRVLVILDDVDELEQLKALCGHGWFGSGSKVIITSRDRQLLLTYGITEERIYSVRLLNDVEALKLFSLKSFKKDKVNEDFLQLSKKVVVYAHGLPLAIELLGSLLFGKDIKVWTSALDRLKAGNPTKKIVNVYKVSFDALEDTEKEVFLDIACFFKGEDKDRVIRILESKSGYSPDIDIEVLMDKSIVNLLGKKVELHDRIQELGWDIVRWQKPYKGSRLWLPKDIIHLLKHNEGTTATEAILLDSPQPQNVRFSVDPFSKMTKLRLLKIKNVQLVGDVKCLSNELQFLEWHVCPLRSLPSDFQSDKLVELRMQSSSIRVIWKGNKHWRMLKFIDMSDSQYLMKTPDFSEVPNLETLILEGCIRLVEVHASVGVLEKLSLWNMGNCKSIKSLPPFLRLESLATLKLSACSKLKMFPKIEGCMERLSELYLDGTAIEELPQWIDRLTGLTFLDLGDCKNLFCIPSTIRSLTSLKCLILTGCSELRDIPDGLSCVECLEELDISGTAIRDFTGVEGMTNLQSLSLRGSGNSTTPKSWHSAVLSCLGMVKSSEAPLTLSLPTSFSGFSSLIQLNINDCNLMDGAIPNDLGTLVFLKRLNLSGNNFVHLPESISQLSKLENLYVRNCSKLKILPKNLPLSLREVNAEDCESLTDYPDQFKVWTSSASGMTTISSIITSKHQTYSATRNAGRGTYTWIASTIPGRSIFSYSTSSDNHQQWKPVEDLSLPNQVLQKQLELLDYKSTPISSGCHGDEIPEWFSNVDANCYVGLRIPPGLKDVEHWMGVSVVVLVEGHPPVSEIEPRPETSKYFYRCIVGTEDFQLSPIFLDWNKYLGSLSFSSHFLFFFYVPCLYFSRNLNSSRLMCAFFETNNPRMEVQKCGIRLLFEQGIPDFIQTYMPPAFSQGRKHEVIFEFPVSSDGEIVDKTSVDSGWLSLQIGGNLRWEELIPTCTKEMQLRRNIESVLLRYLQELKQSAQNYDFLTRGCPAWFNPEVGEQVLIQLLPHENLHKNKKWMGLALCASFVVDKHTVQNDYQVCCRLQRARSHTVGFNMSLDCRIVMMPGTHQLLVLYIPRAVIPELFIQTPSEEISTVYTTSSPGVRVELCGLRVLYPQDLPEFIKTITHCIFRSSGDPPDVVYDKLIKDWLSLIRLPKDKVHSTSRKGDSSKQEERKNQSIPQSFSDQDWSRDHLAYTFPGIEIPDWFVTVGKSDIAQIQLSPSLFYDGSWMGAAVCASLSIHDHPNVVFSIHDIFCFLESNIPNSGVVRFRFPTEDQMWSHACDFVCFVYLPRVLFPESWNQSDKLSATAGSSSTGLGVHNCAIRLVFKEDVNDVEEMLHLCNLSAHCRHCEEANMHQNVVKRG